MNSVVVYAESEKNEVVVTMPTTSEPAAGFDPVYGWGAGEHVHEPLIQSTLVYTNTELEIEKDYDESSVAKDLKYVGDYLLVAKTQGDNYKTNNRYIVVFSARVSKLVSIAAKGPVSIADCQFSKAVLLSANMVSEAALNAA